MHPSALIEQLHNRLLNKIYNLHRHLIILMNKIIVFTSQFLCSCCERCPSGSQDAERSPVSPPSDRSCDPDSSALQMSAAVSDVLGGVRLQKNPISLFYQPARSFQVRQVVVSDPDSRNTDCVVPLCSTDPLLKSN